MKKLLPFLLFLITALVPGVAQQRNMLQNSNFEAQALSDGWIANPVSAFSLVSAFPLGGSNTLLFTGTGAPATITNSKIFTSNNNDRYLLRFTATATTPVNIRVLMDASFGRHFIFDHQVAVSEGNPVVYEVLSNIMTGATADKESDHVRFILDFSNVPAGVEVRIDNIELVQVNRDWTGNIKMNSGFENELRHFWVFNDPADNRYSLAHTALPPHNSALLTIAPSAGGGFSCVTGWLFMWDAITANSYRVILDFEPDFAGSGFVNLGAANHPNPGHFPFSFAPGRQRIEFTWPGRPGGYANTGTFLDINLGYPVNGGTARFFYVGVEEIVPLNAISLVVAPEVPQGTTVPVRVWASPTFADNEAVLAVVPGTGNGTIARDSNGNWKFTGTQNGSVTINAVSSVNNQLTAFAEVVVTGVSSIPVKVDNALKLYPNPASDKVMIQGAAEGALIEIISITGKVVVSELFNGHSVPVASLHAGVYLVRVGQNVSRLVISR